MTEKDIKQVHIYIEEHQGSLYAWRKKDHRFMGQGETVEKLFERMQEDVPDNQTVMFKVSIEDGGEILQKRAKLEGAM